MSQPVTQKQRASRTPNSPATSRGLTVDTFAVFTYSLLALALFLQIVLLVSLDLF
jgi:hypothetical protein